MESYIGGRTSSSSNSYKKLQQRFPFCSKTYFCRPSLSSFDGIKPSLIDVLESKLHRRAGGEVVVPVGDPPRRVQLTMHGTQGSTLRRQRRLPLVIWARGGHCTSHGGGIY
jgi:hypothetical protein